MVDLRPSASYRWTRCAASPTFEGRMPDEPPNDAAREGTCAAWVADSVLREYVPNAATLIGETHQNGWLVTPDMAAHIQGYVDLIRSYGGTVTAEQFVRLTDFIAGTLDTSIAGEIESSILRVKDLKYGMVWVEVYENPQLLIYAGAELLRLTRATGTVPTITHVEVAIYQPRAFHPDGIHRTWLMTVDELWQHLNWIVERGNECQKPNPVATPGPQCDFCRARSTCAALAASVYRNYQVVEDNRQRRMTAEELARELDFLDDAARILKARKSAIEAEAEQRLSIMGEHIPGWHVENGKGNRVFKFDAETIRVLTGVDPTGKPTLITPAELERKGVPTDIVNALSRRPDTGFKLKRMKKNHLAKVFST